MDRPTFLIAVLAISVFSAMGCSAGKLNPAIPDNDLGANASDIPPQTLLWGYYDLYFDAEHGNIEILTNRSVEFSANVVMFLNGDPDGVQVKLNGSTPGAGYIDLDMDITIKHPLEDHAFDGYDVRGIFIGNGSHALDINKKLKAPQFDYDQTVLNADGYTRWFNPAEFLVPGIFGYYPGNWATKGYTGSGTLNPYKYFGEGLGSKDDLWDYLTKSSSNVGYFLAGTSLTRNYLVRFQIPSPGAKFNYAVVADWSGPKPENHPSHAPESMDAKVDVYYSCVVNGEAFMNLDISVFDWDAKLTGGVMKDYSITIESTALGSPYNLTQDQMIPIANSDHWFKYHVQIPSGQISGSDDETWVIVADSKATYKNPAGIANSAGDEKIDACYRFTGPGPMWYETLSISVLEIGYVTDGNFPQYAALHLESGYLRLAYGPLSGWGTSVVLTPCFWTKGYYVQGMPITVHSKLDGDDLLLSIEGTRSGVQAEGEVRLSPPTGDSIHASVNMSATGNVILDYKPDETFKPMMLSSMHESDTQWDAQSVYVGDQIHPFPDEKWIFKSPIEGTVFGLIGGTSVWKPNAPTVEITLTDQLPITGWVNKDTNPNHDNVGFWPATDYVIPSWQYEIVSRKP